MKSKICLKLVSLMGFILLTGCCMDDFNCGGSNTYVPVNSCYSCASTYKPTVSKCKPSCTVCGFDGSYAYTSWY